MLKLEQSSDGEQSAIRIIGRVRSEHLGEIANEMRISGNNVFLDLEDVTIVDVEVVRFLAPAVSLLTVYSAVGVVRAAEFAGDRQARRAARAEVPALP